MSMSHYANTAWVATAETLEKSLPSAWKKFTDVLGDVSVNEFCQACQLDHDLDVSDVRKNEIAKAWKEFVSTFMAATTVSGEGLTITPRYHEDGERGDDISGGFFEIDGMEELTPAGEKYHGLFQRAYWVTYG
jgi:hypothetical protein